MYNQSPVALPGYFESTSKCTRNHQPLHIIIPHASTSAYQSSFFLRTIKDWNTPPTYLIKINNNDLLNLEITDFLITYLLIVCVLYVPQPL